MSTAVLPTTPPVPTLTPPPVPGAPRPILWTCDDLYLMENLPSVRNQKIMLIDGEVLIMPAPSVLASISHGLVDNLLRSIFPADQYWIRSQLGMFFGINTDPVPDLAVVDGPPRVHARHPRMAYLVIEIADTSFAYDTGNKASLYAAAGILDYWVIDVNDRRLHLFRDPHPDPTAKYAASYKTVRTLANADTLSPLAAPTAVVTVGDLMP